MTTISKRQRAHLYIFKRRKNCQIFYITKSWHLAKSKTVSVNVFIYKKDHTFIFSIFDANFQFGIYIQKLWHFVLCDLFYTESMTLRKKQDNLRYVFIYKNQDNLRYAIFVEFLKLLEGGGAFLYFFKQCTLRYILIAKSIAICVMFLYTKSLTFCVTFIYATNNALCVTFL